MGEWHIGNCVRGSIHQEPFQDELVVQRPRMITGYLDETRSVSRSRGKGIRIQIRLPTLQAETRKFGMAGVERWEFG